MNGLLSGRSLALEDADLTLWPDFLTSEAADHALDELGRSVPWRQEVVTFHGCSTKLPRLTAWHHLDPVNGESAGDATTPSAYATVLRSVQQRLESVTQANFNRVLLTLYRHGGDGISWHSDDAPELEKEPIIGTVSLGATRTFMMRDKSRRELQEEIDLSNGSLLVMRGATQRYWQHQIPKDASIVSPRITLTFLLMSVPMRRES